ncbi:MAG: hypothetical protein ACE5I1_24845, partial [bacterium]
MKPFYFPRATFASDEMILKSLENNRMNLSFKQNCFDTMLPRAVYRDSPDSVKKIHGFSRTTLSYVYILSI